MKLSKATIVGLLLGTISAQDMATEAPAAATEAPAAGDAVATADAASTGWNDKPSIQEQAQCFFDSYCTETIGDYRACNRDQFMQIYARVTNFSDFSQADRDTQWGQDHSKDPNLMLESEFMNSYLVANNFRDEQGFYRHYLVQCGPGASGPPRQDPPTSGQCVWDQVASDPSKGLSRDEHCKAYRLMGNNDGDYDCKGSNDSFDHCDGWIGNGDGYMDWYESQSCGFQDRARYAPSCNFASDSQAQPERKAEAQPERKAEAQPERKAEAQPERKAGRDRSGSRGRDRSGSRGRSDSRGRRRDRSDSNDHMRRFMRQLERQIDMEVQDRLRERMQDLPDQCRDQMKDMFGRRDRSNSRDGKRDRSDDRDRRGDDSDDRRGDDSDDRRGDDSDDRRGRRGDDSDDRRGRRGDDSDDRRGDDSDDRRGRRGDDSDDRRGRRGDDSGDRKDRGDRRERDNGAATAKGCDGPDC